MAATDARRRAVFLDRDGVIVEEVNFLHRVEDLRLLPGAAQAIRKLNLSRCLAIVVTNQSVVARNLCTLDQLEEIHARMRGLLDAEGARLDAVYFCPHHPGTGALGANREFEVECDCRKPKTGMIERAKRDFSIDLAHSFMIGDTPADIQCGRNAGLGTIAVRTGHPWPASVEAPDRFCEDLAEAVELILKGPPP